jgi:hypothetical protein
MLPEGLQGPGCCGVLDFLKEAAQPFALRAAVFGIDRVIDVDIQLGGEEL